MLYIKLGDGETLLSPHARKGGDGNGTCNVPEDPQQGQCVTKVKVTVKAVLSTGRPDLYESWTVYLMFGDKGSPPVPQREGCC